MTISFDFSKEVIPLIIKEIDLAKAYIRIAIFQLHNEKIIQALIQKLPQVRVEIFTLPFDSINPDIRPKIESQLRELQKKAQFFILINGILEIQVGLLPRLEDGTPFMGNS